MKTICQKSGIPIWKSDFLLGFDLADEHPIFKAKRNLILNKETVHKFGKAESLEEKKLLYLAVLNHTYLVEFQVPAFPTLKVMESTFYRLMYLAQWTSFAEYKLAKIVSFPQYIIRKDNQDLGNINNWLDAIDAIREKVNKKELERDKNAALLQREMEIKKELGEANFQNRAFTPKLSKWALELCDITIRHPDYNKWMKILCTPLNEAWIYPLEELYEIRDLLQDGLPNLEENPQAISVMHQVGNLIKECRKGFTQFSLIETDETSADFEFVEEVRVEDSDEMVKTTHKINQHLLNVPSELPQLKDYPNRVAWLMAKAKWELAKAKEIKQVGESDV